MLEWHNPKTALWS